MLDLLVSFAGELVVTKTVLELMVQAAGLPLSVKRG